ncbi:MAG: hypothetical protein ACNA8W_11565, partial [Bradymonadaceae bacterium]
MRRFTALVGLIAVLVLSVSAMAQNGPAATPPASDKSFVLAPHIGVTVPQLFGDLGSWPVFGLELGYVIPTDIGSFRRPLQVRFDAMYTAPGATGTGTNAWLGQ